MKKVIGGCLIAMILAVSAHAQEAVLRVSLDEALEMALASNETLMISNNNIGISDALYRQEKAVIYPQVNGEGSWKNNFAYPDVAAETTDDYALSGGVTVEQLVWAFGRVSSAIRAADHYLAASRFTRDAALQDVKYTVKLGYDNVLLARRAYEIAEGSYRNSLRNREILEGRSADGRISRRDNIKMSADVAARVPRINSAKVEYENALQTLRRMIGVAPDKDVELTGSLKEDHQPIDPEVMIENLFAKSPRLKAQASEIAMKRNIVKARHAGYFPQVFAFAIWNHTGTGNSASVGSDNLHDYGVAGLKVAVPLWNGGRTKYETMQAVLDAGNAELNLSKLRKDLSEELRKAVASYNQNIDTLAAYNEAVRLAEESFNLSQDMFASGQLTLTDLNDAELQLTQQKLARESTLFELNVLLSQIERLTVTLTDERKGK